MDPLRGDRFSPADEDDSGSIFPFCALVAIVVIGVVVGVPSLMAAVAASQPAKAETQESEALTVYDFPASDVEASAARTDGPIYDLPEGIGQAIVCDTMNREYLLLTTDKGGVCLVPYLDKDGNQAVMPQA